MYVFKNSERHVNISSEIFFSSDVLRRKSYQQTLNDMLTIIRVSYFVLARSKRFSKGEKT